MITVSIQLRLLTLWCTTSLEEIFQSFIEFMLFIIRILFVVSIRFSGTEEESRFLTKGDNNKVHDQQLYEGSLVLMMIMTTRSIILKS